MDQGKGTDSSSVIVRCFACRKVYKVHTDRLPGGVSSFPCRGCGALLAVGAGPTGGVDVRPREGAPTILVAVNEEDLAGLIRKILQRKGFRVLLGSTGEQTLRIVEEGPVDLLLVNVFFPDLMGFEVLERIRQRENEGHLPAILLSSVHHGARYKRAPTSLYGADDYIERHHLPDLLLPKIERLLNGGDEGVPAAPVPLSDEEVLQKRELEEMERASRAEEETGDLEQRRLCRVIAGDIILYNETRIRNTEPSLLLEALRDDLSEGEALLAEKFGKAGEKGKEWLREEVELLLQMRGIAVS